MPEAAQRDRTEVPEILETEANGSGHPYPALHREVEEIRLYDGLQRMWAARKKLAAVITVFLGAAFIYVLGSRNEYTTTITLMPEQQSESASLAGLDLLQDFGGLLGGMSANSLLQKHHVLPVQIYPEILRSTPILTEILRTPIRVPEVGRVIPVETYLRDEAPFSLWDSARLGLVRLIGWIRPERAPITLADSSVVFLTRDEMRIVEDLQDRVTADLDKKTGVLSVSATMPDPQVAAAVGGAAVQALTVYITRYRLHKLEQDLSFISGRYEEARARFNAALADLATFQDRNQNLSRNLARTEGQRLQAEYDLAFSVYSSLASQLEEAKIKVQEQTPVFQVLQPVTLPLRKSHPKTLLILFLALLAGTVVGTTLVLSGVNLRRIRRTLRAAE